MSAALSSLRAKRSNPDLGVRTNGFVWIASLSLAMTANMGGRPLAIREN